jgi:hypothetical protein
MSMFDNVHVGSRLFDGQLPLLCFVFFQKFWKQTDKQSRKLGSIQQIQILDFKLILNFSFQH